jgi:hypothetical protein
MHIVHFIKEDQLAGCGDAGCPVVLGIFMALTENEDEVRADIIHRTFKLRFLVCSACVLEMPNLAKMFSLCARNAEFGENEVNGAPRSPGGGDVYAGFLSNPTSLPWCFLSTPS